MSAAKVVVAVSVMACVFPRVAAAQPLQPRVRAKQAYEAGDYETAIRELTNATEREVFPDDYYELGLYHLEARHVATAQEYLEKCVKHRPCEELHGDDARAALRRLPTAEETGPAARRDPRAGQMDVEQPRAERGHAAALWLTGGTLGASALVGGYTWFLASSERDEAIKAKCRGGPVDPAACAEYRAKISTDNWIARVSFGVGALSATALIYLLTHDDRGDAVAITGSAHSFAVAGVLRF